MKSKIFIIEDERLIAEDLQDNLVNLGYEVVGNVSSGEEAILLLISVSADIVLVDFKLSGKLDGISTALLIKSKYNIPVVYLTSFYTGELLKRAKETSPSFYVIKPYNINELEFNIEIAIHNHQLYNKLIENEKKYIKLNNELQNENVLRKKYQQELSIQLNKIKTIFQTIPALAVIVDLELNILDLNIQFVQTFTVSDRSNLVGSALKKNILPEHFSFLEKNIQSSIESDDLVENIFHTQSIQGNQNSFKIFFRPVLDSSKTTYAVLIVYVDITDIHQITQKLADSESKYRLLAEKMDDVIWVFNSKTFKYEYVSPSIKKLRGFEVEEVMNQNISESLIVEDFQKVYDKIIAIQTDIKAGKPMEESLRFEFEQMCKNGERKWVEISINIVLDENNDIHRLIGVSRDLSERKKAQIQLENYAKELKGLNATKDKLFSIIAHDLKNPFNTILGFSDIMIDSFESFDNEQKLKFVNHIYTSAQSGYNLLENLLTWSRSQIGNLKSNPVVLDINLIINERIIELNSAAIKKGIYLHMNENDLRNKQIFADEEMINSILRNLISNAIKFSNTDQEILVEANSEIIEGTEYIVVKVMDQGVGIHYELQPNIFNFDPDKSKKGTQGERGTGLGLMICKEFIEINHGTISVESKLGKGSTFFVRIPAYLSDSAI